jgi:hypothetical protein
MPPSTASLTSRSATTKAAAGRDALRIGLIAAFHLAALILMLLTEGAAAQKVVFLLAWGLLNGFWLAVFRRPGIAAALSLAMISILILLSQLKFKVLFMTVNFVDVMIVDTDTIRFLFTIFPSLERNVLIALVAATGLAVLVWQLDPFRVRRLQAVGVCLGCAGVITAMEIATPIEPYESFSGINHVSNFARSTVEAVSEFTRRGYMESDASVAARFRLVPETACMPTQKPPHIILVHDESSFDIRVAPGIIVPPGYGAHFKSFDGKARHFIVEGNGGPSWFTEYNVLAGLSSRSFGRFAYFVTRIAAGRVERGLPKALKRCGYRTFSFYPAPGAFMSARSFQATTGVQSFYDQYALGAKGVEPDSFYYDAAARMIARERANGPMFMYVYLAFNHFPYEEVWRPDLTPQWKPLGNTAEVDEYLRRQMMSAQAYQEFLARLSREFPGESFLLVRYGDHQPVLATALIEPSLDEAAIGERLMTYDPRYFTTYYAIDAVNFKPVNLSSALDTIEGPYLPLIVQEGAGLPLDPSFVEQKRIFERCNGLFYACADGAEARRFNRLLIDAGLIKGL